MEELVLSVVVALKMFRPQRHLHLMKLMQLMQLLQLVQLVQLVLIVTVRI